MTQKKYLVACFNQRDAINTLLQTYAKMQKDFTNHRLTHNKDTMTIQNENLMIVFVTRDQLRDYASLKIVFNGVDATNKFLRRSGAQTIDAFRYSYLKKTRLKYKINDRDGVLSMYVYKGVAK